MVQSELVILSGMDPQFNTHVEQLTGISPSSQVQAGKRPRSPSLLPLAYLKAFAGCKNTEDVREFRGFLFIGILSAGADMDIMDIVGWPTGLQTLSRPPDRRGIASMVAVGTGAQWNEALRGGTDAPEAVQEWIDSCVGQFRKYNIADLVDNLS